MRLIRVLAFVFLLAGIASAQSTTAVTGTFRDLTGSLITSGQVAFTLQPGIDTQVSGTARFTPTEVDCLINGSGVLKALDGTSTCTLVQNTSITTPANTSYRACVQPNFIQPGSCFVMYAIGSTLDITTVPATPSLTPAYNLVDTFSTQTITGTKTFSGTVNFSGALNLGAVSLSGTLTTTNISIPRTSDGTLPATISNDTAGGINLMPNSGKAWEVANSGSLSGPAGGSLQLNGATSGAIVFTPPSTAGSTNIVPPATSGNMVVDVATQTLTNKTLTNPAINGQTADTINQKAATQFLLKDNTGGTRFSIPSNGTSPSVLNNTAIGGASTFTGTLTTPIQGIACADLCVSVITGTPKHPTGQTAAITNSAIGTIGTDIASGVYSAHVSCITTTSGTGTTATPTLVWTDAGGAKTLTLASFALNSTSITGYDNAEFPIHPTSGAVNLNVAGTFGTSVYACDAWLTREN